MGKDAEKREHISIIIDGSGCLRGVVSMEDVIETMTGVEIVDEDDVAVDMQALAKGKVAYDDAEKEIKKHLTQLSQMGKLKKLEKLRDKCFCGFALPHSFVLLAITSNDRREAITSITSEHAKVQLLIQNRLIL